MSIGSAQAGEIASPAAGAKIGETAISHMYRVAWLADFGRQQEELQPAPVAYQTDVHSNLERAGGRARGSEAAVDARISAIAAQVDDEMHTMAAGKPLRYKLHVDCSSKFLAATRPPEGPVPAVLTAFGSDVASVKVSVESCTVKVLWKFLDAEQEAPQMRAYSVSVPIEPTSD